MSEPEAQTDEPQIPERLAYRNPVYNMFGGIDCEVEHPRYGWIPISLAPFDRATAGLFEEIHAAGTAEPYRVYVYEETDSDGRRVVVLEQNPFAVPKGVPYVKLEQNEIPAEPPETWDIDFSSPDGYGTQEQP